MAKKSSPKSAVVSQRSLKKKTNAVAAEPKWKSKWPRNGDLRAWMLCMLDKCDAVENPVEGGGRAHLPIGVLAEMGHVSDALKYVNRFVRKQPTDDSFEIVRLSELGAQICLDHDDLTGMERYLSQAAQAPVHRKCDLGWPEKSVRDFRAQNGILDPAEAKGEEEQITAQFQRGRRLLREATQAGRTQDAFAALQEMKQAAKRAGSDCASHWFYMQELLRAHAEVGDVAAAKQYLKRLGKEAAEAVSYHTLHSIGLSREAALRAVREVRSQLEELATMTNPNIHFPVHAICRAIEFLAAHDRLKEARSCLEQTLQAVEESPVYELGWMTAGVYTLLAEVAAQVNGSEAAAPLLARAQQDAKSEKRPTWRSGSLNAVVAAEARMGKLDEAIMQARKLRSPTGRREQLSQLLARAQMWKELTDVCSEAATPEEAASLCWVVKFELPGGAVE